MINNLIAKTSGISECSEAILHIQIKQKSLIKLIIFCVCYERSGLFILSE